MTTTSARDRSARSISSAMETFAQRVTRWVGTSWAFVAALILVVIWAITGPYFGYSDYWQLVINTGTTITTFLMLFLLQRSQNHESAAMHMKLNEIVSALEGASNALIDAEDLSEQELRELHEHYVELAHQIGNAVRTRQGGESPSLSLDLRPPR
jgi:low affinity Fe/Cu permease